MLENTEGAIKNKRQPGETGNIDKEKQNKDKIFVVLFSNQGVNLGHTYMYVHIRSY